jgi:hypothetical protein
MMNDSMNEYDLMNQFELRRNMLMEEARRERLKANVLRRARQSQPPGRLMLAVTTFSTMLRARFVSFDGVAAIEPSGAVDDCLESPLIS